MLIIINNQEVREVEEEVGEVNEIAAEIPEEIPIETLEDDQIQDHLELGDTMELEIKDEIIMIDEEEELDKVRLIDPFPKNGNYSDI